MARPLRVGIVGLGWGANVQVPSFRYAGLEVAGICSRNPDAVKKYVEENKIPFGTSKYEELVARDDIDLISIVTPVKLHLPMLEAALKAGKSVLVEKPLALNAAEVEQMIKIRNEAEEAARKAGRPVPVCIIDHELRSWSSLHKAREIIADEERFGKLLVAKVSYAGGGRLALAENFTWWNDRAQGGGALGAIGSHCIDTLYFMTGKKIESVSAALLTTHVDKKNDKGEIVKATSDDVTSFRGRIEGGGYLDLHINVIAPPGFHRSEIYLIGSRGAVAWDLNTMKTTYYRAGSEAKVETYEAEDVPGEDYPTFRTSFSLATPLIGKRLAAAIVKGERDAISFYATLEDGLYTQKVMDAIRRSSDTDGAWVSTN